MNAHLIITGTVLAAVVLGIVFMFGSNNGRNSAMQVGAGDIEQGKELYTEYCAACHGANLEGQPDWQVSGPDGKLPAPPHDANGHTWHHPDQVLFDYTKLGGKLTLADQGVEFNSGMPGFGDQLSDREIWNILGFIRSTWSEREQKAQAARTQSATE